MRIGSKAVGRHDFLMELAGVNVKYANQMEYCHFNDQLYTEEKIKGQQ
jgi:hypothetical protein